MVDLSALAFSVRKHLAGQGFKLSLGHAQQLVVAAAGHGTLAAFQTASNDFAFDDVAHWVVDVGLLLERARELGLPPVPAGAGVQAVLETLLPRTSFHVTPDLFAAAVQSYVDDATYGDDRVVSELSNANGSLREIYMPVRLWESLDLTDDEPYEEAIHGNVTLDPDPNPEKVYFGHKVVVEATLRMPRLGKRLFAAPQLEVTQATFEWFGRPRDDDEAVDSDDADEDRHDPSPPLISLAAALANATGLDESDAEQLDYEDFINDSDEGLVFSLILDFSNISDDRVARKLRALHPTMTVEVPPEFFRNVRQDRDGGMF
jgi:hypothetical protein